VWVCLEVVRRLLVALVLPTHLLSLLPVEALARARSHCSSTAARPPWRLPRFPRLSPIPCSTRTRTSCSRCTCTCTCRRATTTTHTPSGRRHRRPPAPWRSRPPLRMHSLGRPPAPRSCPPPRPTTRRTPPPPCRPPLQRRRRRPPRCTYSKRPSISPSPSPAPPRACPTLLLFPRRGASLAPLSQLTNQPRPRPLSLHRSRTRRTGRAQVWAHCQPTSRG
jgi:hypothetical protein